MRIRKLTDVGIDSFRNWLITAGHGERIPSEYLDKGHFTELSEYEVEIDIEKQFATRFDFGSYLVTQFGAVVDFDELMKEKNDGLWAWISIAFFAQLAPGKRSRPEHYIVTRVGPRGSLEYRHGARTSYELVKIHGEKAQVCLNRSMSTFGDMTEQLASRQNIAHNKGFFEVAFELYVNKKGQIKKGAASRPQKKEKRQTGDKTGFGGASRLALALRRLDLTRDTEVMMASDLLTVLPNEFIKKWLPQS